MKKQTVYILLACFFVVSVAARLFVAFQSDYYSYDAYKVIRNSDVIRETAKPLYYDSLSYGGRENVFSPVYYYILSLFSLVSGQEALFKIIPALFSSAVVFAVFLIVKEITRNEGVSLAASFLSAFIPVFFAKTVFSASPYSLVIPTFLFSSYFFLVMNRRNYSIKHAVLAFGSIIFVIMLHPSSFILVLGMVIHLLLSRILVKRTDRRETEIIIFSMFFYLWYYFIIYKKALLMHGFGVVWQNLPLKIIENYFVQLDMIGLLSRIGVFISLLAILSIYHSLFIMKKKGLMLFTSMIIACILLLFFRLLTLDTGLMFLGVLSLLHAGHSFKIIFDFLRKTKISKFTIPITSLIIMLVLFNLLVSANSLASEELSRLPSQNDIIAFEWLAKNTPKNSTVLVTPEEGYLLSAVSGRVNAVDYDFLLVKNADERFNDIERLFYLRTKAESVSILNKYGVNYLMLSSSAQKKWGIEGFYYASDSSDSDCFRMLYDNVSKIYKIKCVVHRDER